MDSYSYLCIILVVECIVFLLCLKYGALTTYRPLISKILDAIKDGKISDEELEEIRELITNKLEEKNGNS